jgi:hypothetical protein
LGRNRCTTADTVSGEVAAGTQGVSG